MAYARRDVVGGAIATTLSAGITSGDTSFTIAAATGWPTGANGDFFVVLDRGNAGEEKVRCASRTGTTCTVQTSGRGSDGTSAAAHTSGVAAEHCLTALDLDEANYAVAKTVGLVTAQGDLLVGSAANTLVKLAKGTSGLPLVAGASTVSYTTIAAAALASEAWTPWTPTVTAFAGTITTVGTLSCASLKIGRVVIWRAKINITTNGTAASGILFTLPYTSVSNSPYLGSGVEYGVATKGLMVWPNTDTQALVKFYDGSHPGANSASLAMSGTYEATS